MFNAESGQVMDFSDKDPIFRCTRQIHLQSTYVPLPFQHTVSLLKRGVEAQKEMLPGWVKHATSFCAGAAAAAFLVQSSSHTAPTRRARTQDDDSESDGQFDGTSDALLLPVLPTRLFRPNENLVIAYDTRTKVSVDSPFSMFSPAYYA